MENGNRIIGDNLIELDDAEYNISYADRQTMKSGKSFITKRIFDMLVSSIGLILFAPVFLGIYIAIKREDGGPVIFKQKRIGYKGAIFTIYKFRSMTVTAEAAGLPMLSHKGDKRLTRIGLFLREHHLDELPQLWNVLKGEMSVVGYRPERKYFVDRIMAVNPQYALLYSTRPGLFSTATLYNGYTDTMEKMLKRLQMDLEYLHTQNMWTDLKIIYLTTVSILMGKKF